MRGASGKRRNRTVGARGDAPSGRARSGRLAGGLAAVLLAACGMAAAGGEVPAWPAGSQAPAGEPVMFECPRAYLGVRQDLLPTHWAADGGHRPLRLKMSQAHGDELLCIYRDERGRSVGTVKRLAPGGYRCISDGAGRFRCRPAR